MSQPRIEVVTVPILPELERAIELAQAAAERERAALPPEVRALVDHIEPELNAALERKVLGIVD